MMPKPAMPPRRERENNLPSIIMTLSIVLAVAAGGLIGTAIVAEKPEPPQGLELGYHPKVAFIDFTDKVRYGKDESTGTCFAVVGPGWRGFTRVPCQALERLKP